VNRSFIIFFKANRNFLLFLNKIYCGIVTWIKLKGNGVKYGKNLDSNGTPQIDVELGGLFIIGDNFKMNSGKYYNKIGRQQPCMFIVSKGAKLSIGNNVGISSTAIVCSDYIIIGDHVKIGGNTCIYDTDFHSLNSINRKDKALDRITSKSEPVHIKSNAFIGAHTTILKGVMIGKNSIVAACSVVTKNVPDNEIWGGNPARFIKHIEDL
jgi:acetyltransferase-like isoleucine patch superfamily enzyme